MENKEKFMLEALMAAEKGRGFVSPNPLVGAVLVKNGKIVGKGWHKKYGARHAEANAIIDAGRKAKGAELYVTLEPCNHYGKQPPCTKAIIEAGIRKVNAAIRDPNKKSKSGAKELKRKGISVEFGMCADLAEEQNEIFIKNTGQKKPFFTLKIAMARDGFITWGDGRRKLISGKESIEYAQEMRKNHDAILVGVNTIIKDNPRLTYRKNWELNPARIILDPKARTPENSIIFKEKGRTIIVCTKKAKPEKMWKLLLKGAEIIVAKSKAGKIDLKWLEKELFATGIMSVMVEGGSKTASAFLGAGLIDRFCAVVSDKEIKKGLRPFKLRKKINFHITEIARLGKDTLIVMKRY